MARQVVIASGNPGKLREFEDLLRSSELQPVSPISLGLRLTVDETGSTYLENALLKARAYSGAAGIPALADDSGLEVDALRRRPGVHSARYGGPGLSDSDRTALVLEQLRGHPGTSRTARFHCALVLCTPGGRYIETEADCEGSIAEAPRGDNGFGYDPIFLLPQFGRSMAELSDADKNQISHRALAVRAMLLRLRSEPHAQEMLARLDAEGSERK
jgi:XTP/dITP diphosphohydrolase